MLGLGCPGAETAGLGRAPGARAQSRAVAGCSWNGKRDRSAAPTARTPCPGSLAASVPPGAHLPVLTSASTLGALTPFVPPSLLPPPLCFSFCRKTGSWAGPSASGGCQFQSRLLAPEASQAKSRSHANLEFSYRNVPFDGTQDACETAGSGTCSRNAGSYYYYYFYYYYFSSPMAVPGIFHSPGSSRNFSLSQEYLLLALSLVLSILLNSVTKILQGSVSGP